MAKKPIFNLRTRKSDTSLVVMIFHFKNRRVVLSTGINIPVKFWSDTAQRAKENREYPNCRAINARLERFENETSKLWYEYQAKGILPTASEFKAELLSRIDEVHEEAPELLPFIRQITEERIAMNRPPGSIQVYNNCLKNLEAYQGNRKKPLTFESLNAAFLSDFTAYLFSQDFTDSYAHKILTTLKMFVRQADQRGIYSGSPLLKTNLGVTKREKDSVYLNEAEIQHLFNLTLDDRLAQVRDSFLIGCFTGLRFSDYTQIKPENIQDINHAGKTVQCLVTTTKKTKQKVVLPLVNKTLKAILERHGWRAPAAISNQKLNKYLKELAQLAGFTQKVEINEYRAGIHAKKTFQKWELISSHTARRSFVSNAFKSGVPPSDIMKFTGHTTIGSFMKYLRVTTEESAVILSEHDFFTGASPLKVVK